MRRSPIYGNLSNRYVDSVAVPRSTFARMIAFAGAYRDLLGMNYGVSLSVYVRIATPRFSPRADDGARRAP